MNENRFKEYCIEYIRYHAILEHLKQTDASIGQRCMVIRKLARIKNKMLQELDH